MAISMLKIRRPLGRLIFNMGIAIPGKTVFLIETAPCSPYNLSIRKYTRHEFFFHGIMFCVQTKTSLEKNRISQKPSKWLFNRSLIILQKYVVLVKTPFGIFYFFIIPYIYVYIDIYIYIKRCWRGGGWKYILYKTKNFQIPHTLGSN